MVPELLATGDSSPVKSQIQKTPESVLVSADEAWVIHLTGEKDLPIWQSNMKLANGVNVVRFVHDLDFAYVLMSARWKDCTGNIWWMI